MMPETVIAAIMKCELEVRDFATREELYIVLDGQIVYPDLVARNAQDHFIVVECKGALNDALFSQCARWGRYANQVYAAVAQPKTRSPKHNALRARLERNGIGLFYVTNHSDALQQITSPVRSAADTQLLASAFAEQPDNAPAPPAGSAAAKRFTPARSFWMAATEEVQSSPGQEWKWIKRCDSKYHRTTPQKARDAVKAQEWQGVRIEERGAITTFWPEDQS